MASNSWCVASLSQIQPIPGSQSCCSRPKAVSRAPATGLSDARTQTFSFQESPFPVHNCHRLLFELYNGLSQYLCGRPQILGAHREPLPVKIELSFDYFDA